MEKYLLFTENSYNDLDKNIIIHTEHSLENIDFDDIKLIFIDLENQKQIDKILFNIKQHKSLKVYLVPTIFISKDNSKNEYFIYQSTINNLKNVNEWIDNNKIIKNALNRLKQLLDVSSSTEDENLFLRIIRYLYVHDIEIEPKVKINGIHGYEYKEIKHLFVKNDLVFILMQFEHLAKKELINKKSIDKIYSCTHCTCTLLNFTEVCEDCKSNDLKVEDLIHHFNCAYVGPLSDFKDDICPKCDKKIEQLGVNYDKPGIVYTCNSCEHTSQDTDVLTTCFNCGQKNQPDNLNLYDVSKISLTTSGNYAALFGLDSLFLSNILDDGLIKTNNEFNTVLEIEIQRIRRYKVSNSNLLQINISNLDTFIFKYGSKIKRIGKELAVIINKNLRTSDLVTQIDENNFLVLLIETKSEDVYIVKNRLEKFINQLFHENFEEKSETKIVYEIIDGSFLIDELKKQLQKKLDI